MDWAHITKPRHSDTMYARFTCRSFEFKEKDNATRIAYACSEETTHSCQSQ